MAVTHARSTYKELSDNILSDIDREDELAKLSIEDIILWILRAEERICQLSVVNEEYRLRYSSDVTDYTLQDRPPITGVSVTGAPITLTVVAHGLAVDDVIFSRDVQGAIAANGRFQVATVPGVDSFTIVRFGRITGISDADEPVITIRDHPFVTGDSVTIADVLGATEVNGTWTATKIDKDTFSVDILGATRNAYTGEGDATAPATNTTTYDGGGRLWKEDEVPTSVGTLKDSSINDNGYIREVRATDFIDLERNRFGIVDYTYTYPVRMALGYKNGAKYLKIDPQTSADGDLDLLYTMEVIARNFYGDTQDMTILLPSEHDGAIMEFVKSKIYAGTLRDPKMAAFHMDEFEGRCADYNLRQPTPRMKMVYR